jgi:hypothetical protein
MMPVLECPVRKEKWGGDGQGGGMLLVFGGRACFQNTEITGNRAVGGAGSPEGQGVGGGLYIFPQLSPRVAAPGTIIADNFASTSHPDVFGELSKLCDV